jgi:GT2 family glycosyltransferase
MDQKFNEEKAARSVDFRRELIDGTENRLNSVPVELVPLTSQTNSASFDAQAAAAELYAPLVDELQSRNAALEQRLAEQCSIIERLESDKLELQQSLTTLHDRNRSLLARIGQLQTIEASTLWQVASRLRAAAGRLPQPVRRYLRRAAKAGYWALTPHKMPARLKFLRERKRAEIVSAASPATHPNDATAEYANWIKQYDTITGDDRIAIGEAIGRLVDPPLISVVMPVYETPERYLRTAIDSVRTQLYPNWELCIADDASKSPHIRRVLEEYRAADSRIKVCYRNENGQISEASNSALAMAGGEFVALLDHDDRLPEHALYTVAATLVQKPELDLIFSDEDKIDPKGNRYDPYFKPDWNPDLMLSQNVFCHLGVYRRSLIEAIGGFRPGYEGSQDYDLVLRASARTKPERIHHIPHILYHWRAIPGSVALRGEEKTYAVENARRAIADHLEENGIAATVTAGAAPGYHRVRYPVPHPAPLVSLIVPTTGKIDILRTCISGILERTDYQPLELIIVPNNIGTRQEVLPYLEALSRDPRVRIIPDRRSGFNFSRVCNIGIAQAKGELIGLINDDLEVIDPGWLSEMVSHAVRPGVGAVGALLRYPTGHIQHAGVIVGLGGVAGHALLNRPRGDHGYFGRAAVLQNVSAITGACLMMPMAVHREVGELDEQDLEVAFNDIDLCLRIREKGYLIVWTPHAELYHHESATRGSDQDPDKIERFHSEIYRMKRRWGVTLGNDPHYNPNLCLDPPEFRLAFPPRVAKPWQRLVPGARDT